MKLTKCSFCVLIIFCLPFLLPGGGSVQLSEQMWLVRVGGGLLLLTRSHLRNLESSSVVISAPTPVSQGVFSALQVWVSSLVQVRGSVMIIRSSLVPIPPASPEVLCHQQIHPWS